MREKLLTLVLFLFSTFVFAGKDPFAGAENILIIGNSISSHHYKPSIGWDHVWGMAATAKEKDYVHQFISGLDRLYPEARHNFKIIRLKKEAAMTGTEHLYGNKYDLIIFQHGENYRGDEKEFGKRYEKVLIELKRNLTKNIICVGPWGLNQTRLKERAAQIDEAAKNQNVPFVNISDLGYKQYSGWTEPLYSKASNGVKWHPSDKAMKIIAERILALSPRATEKQQASAHTPQNATIDIDAQNIIAPVNRKIMGQMVSGADGQYIWSSDKSDVTMRKTGWHLWNPEKSSPETVPLELLKPLRPGVIRYPGGSAVKNFNWKATVGPYSEREPNWRWGLMEFLQWCKAMNSEPQICLSSYKGTPDDQRDLVEFLNSPADSKHPWAMKRAQYGHPKPYNVKYIELGNEPYDGNRRAKPGKQWTVDGYIAWAKATITKIRQVDPNIKIGLPLWNGKSPSDKILKEVGPMADFIIHHTYSVQYAGNLTGIPGIADRIARSCMAVTDQFEANLKEMHKQIVAQTGKSMPIGITEYNTSIKSSKPYVYRKSLAAGIFCIDYIFRMMKPENKILLANYWQIFGGYWGSISFDGNTPGRIWPPYYCFKLLGEHIGSNILKTTVKCKKLNFEGFCAVKPAFGNKYQPAAQIANINLMKYSIPKILNIDSSQVEISSKNNEFTFKFKNLVKSHYPNFLLIPVNRIPANYSPSVPGIEYDFSYEAKWIPENNVSRIRIGLGLMDGRGWSKSGSAIGVEGAETAVSDWKKFSGKYAPLRDTPALAILGRIHGGSAPVIGTLRIRNIKIIPWRRESFPAYSELSVLATKSQDENSITLFVINKNINSSVKTVINLKNFKAAPEINTWTVTGKNISSDTGGEITHSKAKFNKNIQTYSFTPHSITVIKFKKSIL